MQWKNLSSGFVVVAALLACGDPEPGTGTLVLEEDVECPPPERVGATGNFEYSGELVSIDGPASKVEWEGSQRCCYDGVFDVGNPDEPYFTLDTVCAVIWGTPDDGDVRECPYISTGQLDNEYRWDDGEYPISPNVYASQVKQQAYLRDVTPRTWHCDYPITHIPPYDPY